MHGCPSPHFVADTTPSARAKFIAAARRAASDRSSRTRSAARGVGRRGARDRRGVARRAGRAKACLLLTSATHGVEGFCGSGCQVALLHDDGFVALARGAGVAVVFLHAVNPYGFSHLRRTNEDNVDLNRNFRDFRAPPPANAAYADVHGFIVPATWPPPPENEAKIAAYIATHGERASAGGGQRRPVRVSRRPVLRRRRGRRGATGCCARCCASTRHGPRAARLDRFPHRARAARPRRKDLRRPRRRRATSRATGVVGRRRDVVPRRLVDIGAAHGRQCTTRRTTNARASPTRASRSNTGRCRSPRSCQALRADQWLHNHPDAPATQRTTIRQQMRDAFYVRRRRLEGAGLRAGARAQS